MQRYKGLGEMNHSCENYNGSWQFLKVTIEDVVEADAMFVC